MALSGRGGAVDGVPCVRTWNINEAPNQQQYACSNTAGAEGTDKGNVDYTGQFTAYGIVPTVWPGQVFNFVGNINQQPGNEKTATLANAIVTSVVLN